MERELKIVLSCFLVYLMYGLSSLFDTQVLVTPVFLTSPVFFILAVLFAVLNRKFPHSYVLVLYAFAFLLFALVDDFVIGFMTRIFGIPVYDFLTNDFFGFFTFLVFFTFLIFSVWFFYKQTFRKNVAIVLLTILSACIVLFFTDYFLLQEVSFQLFCVLYFIFGQQGSELKDKVLRVVSYQFLLVSLLESFEYFL